MSDFSLARLHELATRFHDAIVRAEFTGPAAKLNNFPDEGCELTCDLLGIYFHENGVSPLEKVVGDRPDGEPSRHAWIRAGDVTIDITAYQFDGTDDAIIVTEQSPFHEQLNGEVVLWGLAGEAEGVHFQRMKDQYNLLWDGLYDFIIEQIR